MMKDFFELIEKAVERKQTAQRAKVAHNYCCAGHSLRRFTLKQGLSQLDVTEVNPLLMERYQYYLNEQCGISRNSSSAYMRSLRAIYNQAVKEGLCSDTRPFCNVFTGVCHTQKRALPQTVLQRLFNLDLSNQRELSLARDLFQFSILARGIAFIDLAKLTRSCVRGNHIVYTRSKTGQSICCAIDATMERLIQRWHRPHSKRLFPILDDEYDHRTYETALHRYNRHLHRLTRLCDSPAPLTSYCARHSWASTAYKLEVPISVISTCMGHASEEITRIYLSSLDTEYIDHKTSIVNQLFATP